MDADPTILARIFVECSSSWDIPRQFPSVVLSRTELMVVPTIVSIRGTDCVAVTRSVTHYLTNQRGAACVVSACAPMYTLVSIQARFGVWNQPRLSGIVLATAAFDYTLSTIAHLK